MAMLINDETVYEMAYMDLGLLRMVVFFNSA